MMLDQNRRALRQLYFDVWQKFSARKPLSALENQIAAVIEAHPDYHACLSDESKLEQDYRVEAGAENPFLHMGLHLALNEQVTTDRPCGISALYQQRCVKLRDKHLAQHQMMEILADCLWQAQRANMPPDENAYLNALRALTRK